MSRVRLNAVLIAVLAFALVFSSVGCGKLSISRLRANHHFITGNKLFTDQKYRDAIDQYEMALKLNPNLGEAYCFLGRATRTCTRSAPPLRITWRKPTKP